MNSADRGDSNLPDRQKQAETDFAPSDYTDGRVELEWDSKYPPPARQHIRLEAGCLACLIVGLPVVILFVWSDFARSFFTTASTALYDDLSIYVLSLLGGALGGTLFSTKWLYHSVAKRLWHLDRRLWRLFTPFLSAGLAFCAMLLIRGKVLSSTYEQVAQSRAAIVGMSILIGYFSDTATAKLAEIAETIFGPTKDRKHH